MHRFKISAAPVDEAQLQRMGIHPGASVGFSADIMHKLIDSHDDGKDAVTMSAPIRAAQGSKYNHSGMMLGIDNEGKGPVLVHNWANPGTQVDPVRDLAGSTSFRVTAPNNATREERLHAAAQALTNHEKAVAGNKLNYSMDNLKLTGVNGMLQRAPFIPQSLKDAGGAWLNRRAVPCAPGQGICSTMVTDAYASGMGRERALREHGVPKPLTQGDVSVTPKLLSEKNPMMHQVGGQYAVPRGSKMQALKAVLTRAAPGKKVAGELDLLGAARQLALSC